ncbi:MAG: hypothetical protein NVS9B2_05850 [Steroidobacteraceae bacterium]
MAGSTRKPDSCAITEVTAQILSRVGSMPSTANAAYISAAHPALSAAVGGTDFSICARACAGLKAGGGITADGPLAQPARYAASEHNNAAPPGLSRRKKRLTVDATKRE